MFISIKDDLIIGRDMPETRHPKILTKKISTLLLSLLDDSLSDFHRHRHFFKKIIDECLNFLINECF